MLNFIRKLAAKQLISERNKPQSVKDLDFVFVDSDGNRYYSWQDLTQIPLVRNVKLLTFLEFDAAKIAPKSLRNIAENIAKFNLDIPNQSEQKKRVEAHSKIAHLCSELLFREEYVTPEETFYNIAALIIVREDESPDTFNQRTFDQKMGVFRAEAAKGNSFFLKSPVMIKLWPWLTGTEESLSMLSKAWIFDQRKEMERIKIISDHEQQKQSATNSK